MATTDESEYIERPLVESGVLERRRYQADLAHEAASGHTLVCLPTGLGKTTVSLLVTATRLNERGGTSLLLAPTKPLVTQHAEFYQTALSVPDEEIVVFTGEVAPDDRHELFERARIVIGTPQVIENDLIGGRIDLSSITHLTFDECHRASGDYAYNYIAERYHADAEAPLVTGMSASPGGDEEAIRSVCENLGLATVAVMTEDDADVSRYTHNTDVEWERVTLPDEILAIRNALVGVIEDRLKSLKELGVTRATSADISQHDLNRIRGELQKLIDNDQSKGYEGMSIHAEVMKLRRAVTLAETQSIESLRRYFERQRNAARSSGASKASQRFVSEAKVRDAMERTETYDDLHPKFRRARILLAQCLGIENGERVIVFTESRDTAETLTEFLGAHFETRKFVGQGDKEGSDGMTQKEQQETLDAFREGEFEVLVSTSVAEEGLDVPEVDLVLFYEPVPTAIRSIQRKGRTGRQTEGRVMVLLAEDTRDEAYFWKSRHEQSRMTEELASLKGAAGAIESNLAQQGLDSFDGTASGTEEAAGDGGQSGLSAFATPPTAEVPSETDSDSDETETDTAEGDKEIVATAAADDGVEIVIDQRELDSSIARDLSARADCETRLETLAVGDYVLSDRVVVERKSVSDFLDTLTGGDRSVFEQVGDCARHYARPVVIIEGEDLYGERNVHPNAIRGALASLAVDFGASVLWTTDESDTADLLHVIAGREQDMAEREVSVHGEKGAKTLTEQQEYVVSAIADIGPVTARALLEEFGSVEAVMTTNEEDLQEVSGVGEVTAERIREVVGSDYEP
ncbi:MAG TPA: DEAD/DEAH box helicase [Halococcus sp.]|nr:DEAD/DEAH box helicase [Halococcus sp.]